MVDVRTENRMEHRVENRLEPHDGRSIPALLRELRDETTVLLRQEVALAKTEISEKAARAGRNTAYLAAGGLVAYAGALFLLLAATAGLLIALEAMGLDREITLWLAPLIVGGIVALVGYGLVQKGITALKHESFVPEKTKESVQENKQWLQDKMS